MNKEKTFAGLIALVVLAVVGYLFGPNAASIVQKVLDEQSQTAPIITSETAPVVTE